MAKWNIWQLWYHLRPWRKDLRCGQLPNEQLQIIHPEECKRHKRDTMEEFKSATVLTGLYKNNIYSTNCFIANSYNKKTYKSPILIIYKNIYNNTFFNTSKNSVLYPAALGFFSCSLFLLCHPHTLLVICTLFPSICLKFPFLLEMSLKNSCKNAFFKL